MENTPPEVCNCGAEFNPWAMRDKGGNQSHPFKSCYNCRMRKKAEREENPYSGSEIGRAHV